MTQICEAVAPLSPEPPAWVRFATDNKVHRDSRFRMDPLADGDLVVRRTCIREAIELSGAELAAAVRDAYVDLGRQLTMEGGSALRFWNFLPDIHGAAGEFGSRYMAFNAGRFEGLLDWMGGRENLLNRVATASAVGTAGRDLQVYVLGGNQPGVSVENPRQRSSYHYSQRFGAIPPCFARATRLGSMLFIGGTASVLGENSCHLGNVQDQTRESVRNLRAVIDAAGWEALTDPLSGLRSVRVHLTASADAEKVSDILRATLPPMCAMELVHAELCRRELLVEIEGVATLP